MTDFTKLTREELINAIIPLKSAYDIIQEAHYNLLKENNQLKEDLRGAISEKDYWYTMHNESAEAGYREGQKLDRIIEKLKNENLQLKEENHKLKTIKFYSDFDETMKSV